MSLPEFLFWFTFWIFTLVEIWCGLIRAIIGAARYTYRNARAPSRGPVIWLALFALFIFRCYSITSVGW